MTDYSISTNVSLCSKLQNNFMIVLTQKLEHLFLLLNYTYMVKEPPNELSNANDVMMIM